MRKPVKNFRTKERVKLTADQHFAHYSFLLIPLMIPALEAYHIMVVNGPSRSIGVVVHLVCVALSLVIAYFKWAELHYYRSSEIRTDEEFENAVLATANKLDWRITRFDKNLVETLNLHDSMNHDKVAVTIRKEPNGVLINSMIKPGLLSAPDFVGLNRKNRRTFFHYYHLSGIVDNLNERVIVNLENEEKRLAKEPEWTLKNTLKRLAAYLASFLFLAIGGAFWKFDGFSGIVPAFLLLGSFYIVLDVYVLLSKWANADS